jgi:hypothetical protein
MRARITTSLSLLVLGLALSAGVASAQATTAATARICKDGTRSAVSGRGACTGHGGVDAKATEKADKAAKKAEVKADKAVVKADKKADKVDESKNAAGAIAQCKDGTYSHAKTTRGACSKHGGIAKALKP